ncbi:MULTISPECIES: helix-turn-helix domain-containing protein [Actinoplanes]|uniref:Spore gernimation protein GerE n=2 Tax=Actinoplanes TaxID=1865 RepID=A0A0X3V7F9_9ACTN|nr:MULTISPECIES: helix-turn-helix transcriptional regulator [Actinoplanes]KUL40162.1 spore gernimation protein GerE [Actinoplanes awajinensis subsp. mycoplanecinus]
MSLQTHRSHTGPGGNRPVLAPHLQEVIESLAAGETAREMAARLCISPNTVKSRLKTLYQQLGARDQAHAVAIGFRIGVLGATGGAPPVRERPDDRRQPVLIGSLDPEGLRDTIADLSALLRIVERVRFPGGPVPSEEVTSPDVTEHLLRQVGELAGRPDGDPRDALARIAEIAAAAVTGADPGAGSRRR